MPAPQALALKELIQLKFISFALKVPANFQRPTGEAQQGWDQAYQGTSPSVPASPPLFLPATMNHVHVEIQKQAVADMLKFFRVISEAICQAWQSWQMAATLQGVMINGPVASLGTVAGPPWEPLIIATCVAQGFTPMQMKFARIIAKVLSNGWQQYTMSIKVPGLPWYPAFAACPSPVAPPMPNTPVPVIALMSVPASMQTMFLKQQMILELGDPNAPFSSQIFEAISDGVNKVFTIWQSSTQVMNVMGTGPVPTFAPPVVPVGPVVAGIGIMTPGGFV